MGAHRRGGKGRGLPLAEGGGDDGRGGGGGGEGEEAEEGLVSRHLTVESNTRVRGEVGRGEETNRSGDSGFDGCWGGSGRGGGGGRGHDWLFAWVRRGRLPLAGCSRLGLARRRWQRPCRRTWFGYLTRQVGAATAVAAFDDCCLAAASTAWRRRFWVTGMGARGDGGLGGTGVAVRRTKIEQRSPGAARGGAREAGSTYLGKRRRERRWRRRAGDKAGSRRVDEGEGKNGWQEGGGGS